MISNSETFSRIGQLLFIKIIASEANDFGFRAMYIRYLDEDVVIVVTTNARRAGNVWDVQNEIIDLVFSDKR